MHIDRLQAETAHQPAMKPLAFQKALSRHRKSAGFTLIEVMIAVVIIGIVAGIAVPSYSNYMTDARRTDAISFLSEVAGEQVRYFPDNNQYATTMKELGYGAAATFTTPEGHYMVSVNNATALKFLLTATPVTGGKQASDAECANFTISNTGQRKSTGTKTDCW